MRRLRRRHGWNLGVLARASTVPRRVLQQIEADVAVPADVLALIAKALGVTVDELVDGTEPPGPQALELTPAREIRYSFERDERMRLPFDVPSEDLRAGDVLVLQDDAIPVDGSLAVVRSGGPRRLVRVCQQLGATWYECLDTGDTIMATARHEVIGVIAQVVRGLPVG